MLGAHHPKVKQLRRLLRDAATRREMSVAVGEGPRVLSAALQVASDRLRTVFATHDAIERWSEPCVAAERSGAELCVLEAPVLDSVSDTRTSQGIVFEIDQPRAPLASVLDGPDRSEALFLLVVDEVGDPGNAGTIVRSAEAFGAHAIVLGPRSVDAYNPKAVRASAGACFAVPIVEASVEKLTTAQVLEALAARGVRRLGARAGASVAVADAHLREPTAIVLGHETRGLSPDLPIDEEIAIPIAGRAESLNLAMAAAVCCYEVASTRRRAE